MYACMQEHRAVSVPVPGAILFGECLKILYRSLFWALLSDAKGLLGTSTCTSSSVTAALVAMIYVHVHNLVHVQRENEIATAAKPVPP